MPTSDINLPVSLMSILWSQLDEWRTADTAKAPVALPNPTACLQGLFVFALVWSLGGSLERSGRDKFSAFLRDLLARKVQGGPERSDYDLGPGLVVKHPEQGLAVEVPEVGAQTG